MKTLLFTSRLRPRPLLLTAAAVMLTQITFAAPGAWRTRVAARSAMQGFAAVPMAADAMRENERAFLSRASEASRQHMRLASVGASQAESSEVRSQALTLAADYREISESLEALIRRKGGMAGQPVGGTSENYQKLLEKAGPDFDRAFIRATAALSNDIMTMFETAAAESRDADVREFAAAQLPVLRAHRNAIADLKKTVE